MDDRYYTEYAAAAIRGALLRTGRSELLPPRLMNAPLDGLSKEELDEILAAASRLGIKIFDYKRSHRNLPRVHQVLGFLKGIAFSSLLDVGSGRGVFLIPFLSEFPFAEVTALDVLDSRVEMWADLHRGGVTRLLARKADITACPCPPKSVDVVTLLEVLEHIPDYGAAIRAAVGIARQYIVVSVPSHEDDNPEHIHLLTKEMLKAAFLEAGVTRLSFLGVPGHMITIARIGE